MDALIYIGIGASVVLLALLLGIDDIKLTRPAKVTDYNEVLDRHTEELIGHEAYVAMLDRVDRILDRHRNDACVSINLTSTVSDEDAVDELHHVLPGEPLEMSRYTDGGMECVGVYSRGLKIGSLMLDDAEMYIDTANSNSITGIYVARQDCYGDYSRLDLGIIVYYKVVENARRLAINDIKNYFLKIPASSRTAEMDIAQN